MKLSIVKFLVVFGFKLAANNVAAAGPKTGLCPTDETFEATDDANRRYTCARIALEKAAAGTFDCDRDFFKQFKSKCPIECGECDACADGNDEIVGFKKGDKKCKFISGKKKKKIKKYCRKNKKVLEACPLTCDNCDSNAPTDSYVCEDTSFVFPYKADVDPITTVPFTCAKLNEQYNVGAIEDICKNAENADEIKVKCPVLCDNCNSASPSVVSSAPSSKPSVLSTTCVDKKVRGTKIEYFRGKVVDGKIIYDDPAKKRKNKKCKQLATEPKATIVEACKNREATDGSRIADYCKLTCDNCGISAAPSITATEAECADDDVNTWNYEGETVTCTDLRGKDELTQADICKKKNGAKTNCISTCNLCPE